MRSKILVIGPSWVGDMVMAQCLFQVLKQQNPDVVIDVLAPAWSLPLLARMSEVNESIIMPIGHGELKLCERYRIARSLRAKKYDQAIVCPNSFKSALIPFWAKIPVRTGWRGEMRYGVLNDVRVLDKRYPLMIEQYMALGLPKNAALPNPYPLPALKISETTRAAAVANHKLTVGEQPILALCPGAEFGPAKRWPEEYYAAVANEKLAQGWQVWVFGSPKDQTVAEKIMELTGQRCVNLTGKTRLEEAVDLLSLATGVVSNDSGLMHISAALQKPLIAVYGPTSAGFTPPLHASAKVLTLSIECQPCFQKECPLKHHRCMLELEPKRVLDVMSGWSLS